mmetsp:Transcript_12820/g.15908  ORF Transcript_12820/g.15908 Transcript_12820/m.15908 type:complete len:154 (-) Transcript_12820:78-539(-)
MKSRKTGNKTTEDVNSVLTEIGSESNDNNNIFTGTPTMIDYCKELLNEMNIKYDDNILFILNDFSHNYLTKILKEAIDNANHRNSNITNINEYDIKMGINNIESTYIKSPNNIDNMEISAQVNRIPLPIPKSYGKIKLPPKPYRLTSNNYALK